MTLAHYVTLGRSGLRVSRFCLGGMTFGNDFGFGSDAGQSAAIIDRFIARGGNFIDTANLYNAGHSEAIIGAHLGHDSARRDRLVLSTKFSTNLHPGDPNGGGANRKAIIAACDESLRRLRTDYIDLYFLHWDDPFTPLDETMRALDDLVTAGKIRYVGLSDLPAWKVTKAQLLAELRGWSPVAALQIEYSLLERTVESEFVPMALDLGIGILPWSPLRMGALSGKYTRENAAAQDGVRGAWATAGLQDRDFEVIDAVRDIAADHGCAPASIALAWLTARPGVSSTLLGARTIKQLDANLAALTVTLSPEEKARLDAVSMPQPVFPMRILPSSWDQSFGGLVINGRRFGASAFVGDGARA